MEYKINIFWDDEANVWVAISDDIPLALESNSYDALIERLKIAAPEILELNAVNAAPAQLNIKPERPVMCG